MAKTSLEDIGSVNAQKIRLALKKRNLQSYEVDHN